MDQNQIVNLEESSIKAACVELTGKGLELKRGTSLEGWREVWGKLRSADDFCRFAIADCVAYFQAEFRLPLSELATSSGIDLTTLRQMSVVSQRVPLSCRASKLTYAHAQAVSEVESRERQMELIQLNEEENLKPSELRALVRKNEIESGERNPGEIVFAPFPAISKLKTYIANISPSLLNDEANRQKWKQELKPLADFYAQL
tara:strand:- start:98 stop:706 length:609 start_codon:yes stop_codon:yes gene_type:complete